MGMAGQVETQISTSDLSRFFEFLDSITEDVYYVLHYVMYPAPRLIIADVHGEYIATIEHPEAMPILHVLLSILLEEGVPVSGEGEIVLAISGEELISLIG